MDDEREVREAILKPLAGLKAKAKAGDLEASRKYEEARRDLLKVYGPSVAEGLQHLADGLKELAAQSNRVRGDDLDYSLSVVSEAAAWSVADLMDIIGRILGKTES